MSKKLFVAILFLFAIGLCLGTFIEVFLEPGDKTSLFSAINSLFGDAGSGSSAGSGSGPSTQAPLENGASASGDTPRWFGGVLWSHVRVDLVCVLLIMLSPLLIITIPISPIVMLFKAVSMGFSSALLIESFGTAGLLHIITTLLPQCILEIPVYTYLICASLFFAWEYVPTVFDLIRRHSLIDISAEISKRNLLRKAGYYLLVFGIGLILLTLSNIIEVALLLAVS